jgi:hypothetical protein
MLAALIDGEQDVNVIADMAKASMRTLRSPPGSLSSMRSQHKSGQPD